MEEENAVPYKAFQSKVDFMTEEELSSATVNTIQDYIFRIQVIIKIIEIDLEWKEDETPEWRSKAINALKSHTTAMMYAKRELESRK